MSGAASARQKYAVCTTARLELIALDARLLELWVRDLPALERELGIVCRAEPLEGDFLGIVRGQLAVTQRDPENYLWHSFWLLVRRSDGVTVGSADFKAPPDAGGETEIGYGLGKAYEHCGYMTEAVGAMCAWALAQPGVRHVIAETERDNLASRRVLERCGFSEYRENDTIWWRR
ncbi:MAG: GNAT family N-acetyltransferase [Oscillospiraceae bacterium]|nr:GNAT family N-acetyltransferase [Oscillospiraceae bacterium]